MDRRSFLKLGTAAGVAIAVGEGEQFKPSPSIIESSTAVEIDTDADIVIDLEKVFRFEIRIDNNPRREFSGGNFGGDISLGIIDEHISIDIGAETWLLPVIHNAVKIRVIDKRVGFDRQCVIADAAYSVDGPGEPIMLRLNGILIA